MITDTPTLETTPETRDIPFLRNWILNSAERAEEAANRVAFLTEGNSRVEFDKARRTSRYIAQQIRIFADNLTDDDCTLGNAQHCSSEATRAEAFITLVCHMMDNPTPEREPEPTPTQATQTPDHPTATQPATAVPAPKEQAAAQRAAERQESARRAALRNLAQTIQRKRADIEARAISDPDVWNEYRRLCRQFDAVSACENWPAPLTDLPLEEQRAAQIEAAAACIEHCPALARPLQAAMLDWEDAEFTTYIVPSEGVPNLTHAVTLDNEGAAHCDCLGFGSHGHCWHDSSAKRIHALRHPAPAFEPIDFPTENDLCKMEAQEPFTAHVPLPCFGPARRPRSRRPRVARVQSVPQVSPAYAANLTREDRPVVDYTELAKY